MRRQFCRIGIFGGSFNPVHEGHIKLAETALSEFNLNVVIFVPTYLTPLKNRVLLEPAAARLKALKKALKPYPAFLVSDCEIRRKGVSYTVDTLRYFKKKYGPKAVLYFLSGADTLKNLKKWKSLDRIKTLCRFVAASRPGYSLKRVPSWVLPMPMDALDISSTDIRKKHLTGRGGSHRK